MTAGMTIGAGGLALTAGSAYLGNPGAVNLVMPGGAVSIAAAAGTSGLNVDTGSIVTYTGNAVLGRVLAGNVDAKLLVVNDGTTDQFKARAANTFMHVFVQYLVRFSYTLFVLNVQFAQGLVL